MLSLVVRTLGLPLVRGPVSVPKNRVISVILIVLALSIPLAALFLRTKVTAMTSWRWASFFCLAC
jgi:hypothetical protein